MDQLPVGYPTHGYSTIHSHIKALERTGFQKPQFINRTHFGKVLHALQSKWGRSFPGSWNDSLEMIFWYSHKRRYSRHSRKVLDIFTLFRGHPVVIAHSAKLPHLRSSMFVCSLTTHPTRWTVTTHHSRATLFPHSMQTHRIWLTASTHHRLNSPLIWKAKLGATTS